MNRSCSLVLGVALLLAAGCASSGRTAGSAAGAAAAGESKQDARDPLAAMRLLQLGQSMVAEGRLAEGIAQFKKALRLQGANPTIHNVLGVAELQQGNSAQALEDFNRALELAPSYLDARANRGSAYLRLGQVALAEADFLAALADPAYANRPGVYFNLGALYFARGNLAAAEENLKRATLPVGSVDAYMLLGKVEERLGKVETAEVAYRGAHSRGPERPDAALALGEFLASRGRTSEAQELYRQVIEVAPSSAQAKRAHELLGR